MWSTRWSESLLNISDYDGEERRERSPGPLPHQWGFVPSPWSHIAQLSPERAVATHTFRGALLWFVWVQMKKRNKVKQTRKQHVNRTQSALHKLLRCVCLLCIWYVFKSEFKLKHLSSCCWLRKWYGPRLLRQNKCCFITGFLRQIVLECVAVHLLIISSV